MSQPKRRGAEGLAGRLAAGRRLGWLEEAFEEGRAGAESFWNGEIEEVRVRIRRIIGKDNTDLRAVG